MIKKRRLENFVGKDNETAQIFRQSHFIKRQLEWCDKALTPIGESVTSAKRTEFWRLKLQNMVDTSDLTESRYCPLSNSWVDRHSDRVSGSDYIHYHHIRVGCLPSRARTTRGSNRDRMCRARCRVSETNYHVIQICQRTHGGRVLRHDRVVDMLQKHFTSRQHAVVKEPVFRTSAGKMKPDLLVTKDGKTYVLDFQVVSGRNVERDHTRKCAKYRSVQGMDDIVKRKCASRAVEYQAITFTYKGLIERNTWKLLQKLQIGEQLCFMMVTSVLRGTWLNWNQFNKSTALAR